MQTDFNSNVKEAAVLEENIESSSKSFYKEFKKVRVLPRSLLQQACLFPYHIILDC